MLSLSGFASGLLGEEEKRREDAEKWGGVRGYQDKRCRRDNKEGENALVVKRKQLRETEEERGGDEQREADSADWNADGSKTPSLRFPPPLLPPPPIPAA